MKSYGSIIPANHVVARPVLGEMVLLDVATEQYLSVNSVGTRIWELLADGATVAETVATLEVEYQIAHDVVASDVEEFVDRLLALGLASDAAR